MEQLDLWPWAQKVIVSVLLAVAIQLVALPRLRGKNFCDVTDSDFGGSGQALDESWPPKEGSTRRGKGKSRLVSDSPVAASIIDEPGANERRKEHQVLGKEYVPSPAETETDYKSVITRNDAGSTSEKSKPFAIKRGRKRQQQMEPRPPTEIVRPKLKSKAQHPGLGAFHIWHSAISDIYRSYTIGRTDGTTPALPIIPRSERGNVPVHLEVANATSDPFDVFWIDYKGNEEYKGSASPGSSWYQQTWIGHPWTFRAKGGRVLLHFVPFRVIQTTARAKTVNTHNEGVQRFTILPASSNDFVCDIDDPIFPFPSTKFKSPQKAFDWSCSHMEREGSSPRMLLKYLHNVLKNPDDPKYRQIRTANRTFWNGVWITAARGMLHALGFEEIGAYVEMGPEVGALPADRVNQVSRAVSTLEALLTEIEGSKSFIVRDQPEGADGFGRAGFGRVGMN